MLSGGDVAFMGIGPGETDWFIGIEHKQVNDVIDCMKTGRFTGTQLPQMLQMYDMCFLLIEGRYVPDYSSVDYRTNEPRIWIPRGGGFGAKFGMTYKAFENFQTSVAMFSALAGKPCVIKRTENKKDSVAIIRALYDYFQKPWSEHKSMSLHDHTKMQRAEPAVLALVEPDAGDADYPKLILRKSVYQIQGIGWEVAGTIADKFGCLEAAMAAGAKDFEALDGIGAVIAKRCYEALHGHPDPAIPAKKKRNAKTI